MLNRGVEESVQPVASAELLDLDNGADKNCAFTEEELERFRQSPDKVVTTCPPMLGYASTVFIIVNRMVGTGIFLTSTALSRTHSVACSLAFWAVGGIVAVSGAHVFAEFGLTVPRMDVNNEGEDFVPRNGGEKNYIEYFFKKPRLLATCIYGIPFIIMGNVAGNTLICAESILRANRLADDNWTMRAVAVGIATFACALHAIWRKGGVYVNNAFGFVKILMLLALFFIGAAYVGGQFHGSADTANENLNIGTSTANASSSAYDYAQAFLAILFSFGGFHQANYVLGEVRDCRHRFKVTSITTVACVSVLFFLVNLAYMFVVPRGKQFADRQDTVARNFFHILFGARKAPKVQYSLMAFSSLGNIIVQTFTAARVKQEIAKEGIIPPRAVSKFFAENYSLTPEWLRSKKNEGSEDTPAAAFLLHWIFAVLLILATVPAKADSYRILVNMYSFIINAVFGFLVGLGLLILRFKKGSEWTKNSSSNAWISVITAAIFTIANLFPLVAIWIRPPVHDAFLTVTKSWFIIGTVGTSVMAFAILWWTSLRYVIPWFSGKELETNDRDYNFIKDHGYWVMRNEIVSIQWKPVR